MPGGNIGSHMRDGSFLPFRRIGGLSADTDHWEKIVLRRTETWAVKGAAYCTP